MEDQAELARALVAYCDPSSPEYDADFDREMRRLRPDWFDDWDDYVRQVRQGYSKWN